MKAAGISGVGTRKRWRTTIRIPGITPATVSSSAVPVRLTERTVGRQHHLPADRRGLAPPRRRAGRVLAGDRRLFDGHAHARDACGRRAQDGDRSPAPDARLDPPLLGLDGLPRRPVTTTPSPNVLRHPQKELVNRRSWPPRLDCSQPFSSPSRRSTTASAATPPSACLPPGRLRTTTTLAAGWLRTIGQTTTININNHNPRCHVNRGRSKPCLSQSTWTARQRLARGRLWGPTRKPSDHRTPCAG